MTALRLERIASNSDETIGILFVDDFFQCFTLEDEYRTKKKYGETRIPAGNYTIKVKKFGGFHNRYAKRFPLIHRGMLQLENVPGFTDILIHIGNDDDDTAGCILLGDSVSKDGSRWKILQSTRAYTDFYSFVIGNSLLTGASIEIIDRDLSIL